MDIEHLSKTQIILLTLLVSFVTSIATGIATVSLIEEAPTDVTRVISRIVERPIEVITPGKTEVVTREHTVVVNETERIAKAISSITPSLVRLYTVDGRNAEKTFEGIGVIVSTTGTVVADSRIVRPREDYVAQLFDGKEFTAEPSEADGEQGVFALKATSSVPVPVFTAASFESFEKLSLGQTVIAVGGQASTAIAPGVIAELIPSSSEKTASRLRTTIDPSGVVLGSPLITLDGIVIGMPEEAQSMVFLSLGKQNTQTTND